MNAATHIGRGTMTDVSTVGMDGVLSMTHGIMAMQDGTEAGMPDGTDGIPTTPGAGDGMTIIILYTWALEEAADIGQVPLNASRTTDSHAQAPPESVAAA